MTTPESNGASVARAGPAPYAIETVERSRVLAELEASELHYRRLFETARDGILLLDAQTGRITDVNPFLEDLLGYVHADLVGCALWEIVPAQHILSTVDVLQRLQAAGAVCREELPLETRTRRRVQVELVSSVCLLAGARVIQCHVRDISARSVAEAGALRLKEKLVALVAELRRRDGELRVLGQLSDQLRACDTQEEACQVLARLAGDLLAEHSGFLALHPPSDRRLELAVRWGDGVPSVPPFDPEDCWALRRGLPHEVAAPSSEFACRHFPDPPPFGHLCVPLGVQGETLGLLCLVRSARQGARGAGRLTLAVTLAESIKLSLTNLRLRDRLREQAIRDSLSGLYNRRYLDETLARELHRAQRRGSPLCVAMLDLDHFKQFNDAFGHEAGDVVLRELGQLLQGKVRRSDVACRYGGEEFVLVFPDSSLADTRQRVDQIRTFVRDTAFRHGEEPLGRITVSAGVAQANPGGCTPAELLHAADVALYAAKQAGRDCVVEHSPTA
jgi:diguanylate cyclase (GGDEF)-like protein/PAS domain S-box-containing protein